MITIKNYNTRFPNNNSEYFNKLTDSEKEEYLNLYQKYHKLTLKYLIEKLSLMSYDKTLKNNESKFIQVEKEDMDLYQYLCSEDLNYFYLRNNFYIERLTTEELDYLKNVEANTNENEFIEKTLKKVITELPDKDVNICFGSNRLDNFKPNGSLIIGVRYDEFSDKIPDDEKWLDTYTSIKGELEFILEAFGFAYKSINDVPIEVLNYNEYSTVRLNKEVDSDNKADSGEEIESNNEADNKETDSDKEANSNNIIFY